MQDVTSSLISKFVSEIGEMQNRLNELEEINIELEEELGQLRCVKEESHVMKASLEEQLANSKTKNEFLSANLQHQINERRRVEEEFQAIKASLEEQLAKRESEMDMLMNNLKSEREAFNQTLGNLRQQFDTWLDKMTHTFQELMDGNLKPLEYHDNLVLTRQGQERIVTWHNTRLRDEAGNIIGGLSSEEDITERKCIEETLRESEARYRNLVKHAPAAIYEMDVQGTKFLSVNDTMCSILGYSREELFLMKPTDLLDEEGRSLFKERLRKKLEGEKVDEAAEYHIRRTDGKWIHAAINVRAYTYSNEEPSRVTVIGYDITERKQAEEQIKSLLAEKELLLKEVHHRVKNNMFMIMSLLSLQASTLKDSGAISSLQDAKSRVQSMMVLYDKLSNSAGSGIISTQEYLTSLVNEIINNFPNRGQVVLEAQIDDFHANAKIALPIGIIINELLTNIMKHAFVGRKEGLIRVSFSIKDNHATLIVSDNGVGIPESINIESSTGFGLRLVSGIITIQLEGTIRIERGNGTKFVLEFDV